MGWCWVMLRKDDDVVAVEAGANPLAGVVEEVVEFVLVLWK